jgi:hypothetical protein
MTRQERRKQERLGKIVKDLGMKTLSFIGFYYKGAGMTLQDASQISKVINIFDDTLPDYKKEIKEQGQSEIDFYFNQIDDVRLNYLDKNIEPPHEKATIFMMNIYVLTKLGIIKDDMMNGLQYMYTK